MSHDACPLDSGAPPPPAARAEVPWTGRDILIVFFLVYLFWVALAQSLLLETGFFAWYYGPEAVALVTGAEKRPKEEAVQAEVRTLRIRFGLWASLVAFPLQLATIPLVLLRLSGARPPQYGLTAERCGRNVLLGVIGWAVWTPVVLSLYAGVVLLYTSYVHIQPEEHPLSRLVHGNMRPAEWVVWFLSPLVVAPVLEEILFRGLIQPWARARAHRTPVLLGLALLLIAWNRKDRLAEGRLHEAATLIDALVPVVFALLVAGLVLLRWRREPTGRWPGLLATALFFASIHASWPSPVALVLLGIGLGDLADRTRSLVGPIVLHSLFNAVSCVVMFYRPGVT